MSYDRLSRYLSLILRHHPEVIGISLDAHGWADVDELIAGIAQKKKFNREILEEIVRTDKKQRYSFSEDGTKIRANQGHSVQVDLELQPIEPPDLLWHGTAEKYADSIQTQFPIGNAVSEFCSFGTVRVGYKRHRLHAYFGTGAHLRNAL